MDEKVSQKVGGGAVDTSLVSYCQTVTKPTGDNSPVEPDLLGCPNMSEFVLISQSTGNMVPARCGRLSCWYCCRVNAKKRSLAIAYSGPEREVTLTLVGDSWDQVRDRMKNLRHRLRKEIPEFEWVWHVEQNPKHTGHHVHAWQRGSFVPQKLLSSTARGLGMGSVVHVSKLRSVGAASRYGLKGLTYGLKGVLAENEGASYLDANGSRLTHQSRGFFASPQGEKLAVREAERQAATVAAGEQKDLGPWVLMRSA